MDHRSIFFISLAILACLGVSQPLAAEAKTPSVSGSLGLALSTKKEIKLSLAETLSLPVFYDAENGLFAGNRLDLTLSQAVSPITAELGLDAVLTPIAFLQFSAGVQIGSGWTIPGVANGLGINTPLADGSHGKRLSADPLSHLMYKFKFGGLFQFDLAAIVPGDWNHLVTQVRQEINYRALAGVGDSVSWLYEADNGENRNGWNYSASYLLGWQMPLLLNLVGVKLDTGKTLVVTPGGQAWGEDLMTLSFGPLLLFKFSEGFSLAVLAEWTTERNCSAATAGYGWYQDRVLDSSRPVGVVFSRVAAAATLRF